MHHEKSNTYMRKYGFDSHALPPIISISYILPPRFRQSQIFVISFNCEKIVKQFQSGRRNALAVSVQSLLQDILTIQNNKPEKQ